MHISAIKGNGTGIPFWQTPYRVHIVPKLDFFIFEINEYHVQFEEDTLFVTSNRALASKIVGALNGAYNLGRHATDREWSTYGIPGFVTSVGDPWLLSQNEEETPRLFYQNKRHDGLKRARLILEE